LRTALFFCENTRLASIDPVFPGSPPRGTDLTIMRGNNLQHRVAHSAAGPMSPWLTGVYRLSKPRLL